jgi:RND family efflux transporter MFP subunit
MKAAAWVLAMISAAGAAQAESFAVGEAEIARLGVKLAPAEATDRIVLATAPAEVVVPPARQAVVGAPVDGLLTRLLVAAGEKVEEGRPIAEIDSTQLVDWQRGYLEAAAQAELEAAQLARDRDLYTDGIIAERRLQETTARARAAELERAQAAERLRIAGFDKAAVAALTARRELSSRLTLRAPLGGVIAAEHVKVGAHVSALDAVVTVMDVRTLWLELHVAQDDAARVASGMVAAVTVGGKTLEAPVTVVGQVVDAATQTVLVRAELDNAAGALRAGQFLQARVLARVAAGAFALPTAAVTHSDGAYVFVRDASGFDARRIEIVAEDGERVYVVGGIDRSGQPIAVEGISALKSLWLAARETGG